MTEYTSVKLPKAIAQRVNKAIEEQGYRSMSDFVIDSTRRRLEELRE